MREAQNVSDIEVILLLVYLTTTFTWTCENGTVEDLEHRDECVVNKVICVSNGQHILPICQSDSPALLVTCLMCLRSMQRAQSV